MHADFELENALREIRKMRAKIVLVQLPEGLKGKGTEIARMIERGTGAATVLSAEPCYGACDIADDAAKALGADLVLHIGHAKIPNLKTGVLTVFVPLHYEIGAKAAQETAEKIKKTGFKKAGLCSTIQYAQFLPALKKELEKMGVTAFIGKGGARIAEEGQVLGCDCSSVRAVEKKADAVVFAGDGMFHPIAVSYCTKKPIIMANPKTNPVSVLVFDSAAEREKFIRRRFGAIARAKDAKVFGIIMGTKKGQMREGEAMRAKRIIEAKGREAVLLASSFVREEYFTGMGIDCFVSTACPRIAPEDGLHWKKPVLTVRELEILLGKRKAGDYAFDALG
ncbi:MAG: diphthamide biosynthesis enzyme Dph2 [Candidatus Diapherotrites archaeon]